MSQKVVFIVGASSGIGFALAKEFALRGYKVYAGSRNVSKMAPLEKYNVITMPFDVTDEKSIEIAREKIEGENDGKLDLLYLNAGIGAECAALDITMEVMEKVYKTNVFGPVMTTKAFQRALLKAKGTLAITSTTAILFDALPFRFLYSSSKKALDVFAHNVAAEAGQLGLRVVNIRTGSVDTDIWEEPSVPPKDSIYYLGEGQTFPAVPADNKWSREKYAKSTVDVVVKAMKNEKIYTEVYRGADTLLVRALTSWFSFRVYLTIIWRLFNLNGFFDKVQNQLGY